MRIKEIFEIKKVINSIALAKKLAKKIKAIFIIIA